MAKNLNKKTNILLNTFLLIFIIHTILLLYILIKNFNYSNISIALSLISILMIIFYFFLIFTKNIIKLNLLLSIFIVYISIYSFEIYLDISGTTFKDKKELDDNFDTRTKREVLLNFENKNEIVYPGTYYFDFYNNSIFSNLNLYPFAGISNSKTISCNELGFWPVINRDKFGFSNKFDFYEQDIDYLLIGDSFAEGWCVNEINNLQNILIKNNKKTISLGISGSGPLLQLAILQEYKKILYPKKIIIMYYEGNDLKNLSDELNNKILLKYFNDINYKQDLTSKQQIIDLNIRKFIKNYFKFYENDSSNDLTYSNKFYRIGKLSNIRLLINLISSNDIKSKNSKKNIEILNEYNKILNKIKIISNELNSELYFVYIPDWTRVKQRKLNEKNLNYKKSIIDLVNDKNIIVIDFTDKLKEMNNPLTVFPFKKHGHFNKDGYLLLYQQILEIDNKND